MRCNLTKLVLAGWLGFATICGVFGGDLLKDYVYEKSRCEPLVLSELSNCPERRCFAQRELEEIEERYRSGSDVDIACKGIGGLGGLLLGLGLPYFAPKKKEKEEERVMTYKYL
jgi:hypothetical protein